MIQKKQIKAIAFDFGGTLDSPFLHWMKIYVQLYTEKLQLPITTENFRDSYIYAERQMEILKLVKPNHSLLETQRFKTRLQFDDLIHRGILDDSFYTREELPDKAATLVTDYACRYIERSKPVLSILSNRYTLLLVSNYYGNLNKLVADFHMNSYFTSITDSTIIGIRKPDVAIWERAINEAGFCANDVLIVGDSMKNDIKPGIQLGCQVIQGCPSLQDITAGIDSICSLNELLPLLL